jgi:hypothetical protein
MSYLDTYGAKDARREKIVKRIVVGVLALAVVSLVLYFQFRNYREEQQVKRFLDFLRSRDYKAAYALWGCTDATPCPQYGFDKFLEDWGPASPLKDPAQARIADFRGCDTGVIGFIEAPGQDTIQLWVERRSGEIAFAPWQIKAVPPQFRARVAALFWDIAQDCKPLIGP